MTVSSVELPPRMPTAEAAETGHRATRRIDHRTWFVASMVYIRIIGIIARTVQDRTGVKYKF